MYVVGAQKNRLNETVLLSTKTHSDMFKLRGKKIITILCSNIYLIWTYVHLMRLQKTHINAKKINSMLSDADKSTMPEIFGTGQ